MCQTHRPPEIDAGALLIATSEPGIYVRSGLFQTVVEALQRGFFRLLNDEQETHYRSPGFIPRRDLAQSEYVDKFPQFVARVTPELDPAAGELLTLPSACLSLYPVIAARGAIPDQGLLTTVSAPCFRNEAHYAPERMRAFSMAEFVFFGGADQVAAFRERTLQALQTWVADLSIHGRVTNASDPFFGRMGEMLAERQKAANLKLELLAPTSANMEVAAFSINDHGDFFCSRWGIRGETGQVLRSSCVGVGLERLALAMFHRHGRTLETWPATFRELL